MRAYTVWWFGEDATTCVVSQILSVMGAQA